MKKIYQPNNDILIQLCKSITEFRILAKIIEKAQTQIPKGCVFNEQYNEWNIKEVSFKVIDISNHGARGKIVKDALIKLRSTPVKYNINDDVELNTGIILSFKANRNGTIEMLVDKVVWDMVLNFTRGFKKLDSTIYNSLRKHSSIIFYFMICDNSDNFVERVPIDKLRKIFHIEDKYKLTAEIERVIIAPAQKELDEKSDYSFNYKKIKDGRNIVAYEFTKRDTNNKISIKRKQMKRDIELKLNVTSNVSGSVENRNKLLKLFNNSKKELSDLNEEFDKLGDDFVEELIRKSNSIRNVAKSHNRKTSDVVRGIINHEKEKRGLKKEDENTTTSESAQHYKESFGDN